MQFLRRCAILSVLFVLACRLAAAQQTDTLEARLPEIRIEAARDTESAASAPFAVAVLRRAQESVALDAGLSLERVLAGLPGVRISDRGHTALGERLLVRGMGWRAAFGVRGVAVLLDGLPLTLPDGQAVLDIVDPAFIRQAELIRGPASLFWGNGSGGVLFLSTAPPTDSTATRLRVLAGGYGVRQFAVEQTLLLGRHRLSAFASDVRRDGHRAHSAGGFTRAALHGAFDLGARTRLRLAAALALQDTDAPGSLTADEVAVDRSQADARYAGSGSGKESLQVQAGASVTRPTRFGLLSATAYGLMRRLDNPLPFAYIDLNRTAAGVRLQVQAERGMMAWAFGIDAGRQRDDRLNADNDGGMPGTDVDLDQVETVRSLATFGRLSVPLAPALDLSAGLRFDAFRFALDDALTADGDQSGTRSFSAWSPAVGLAYRLGPAVLFANVSTAFETPTTTELVNRPDGGGGFNPDVGPQHTRGVEGGARGAWTAARLSYDLAVFHLSVRDRLLPFQDDEGRTYYRNAGTNTHNGVEIALGWDPRLWLSARLTYTGSHFTFEDAPLTGNRLPGVPTHHLHARVHTVRRGWQATVSAEFVGSMYADDANLTVNPGYSLFDLNLGHRGLYRGRTVLQPFVEVHNVLDRRYNGSLIVNARGGRYFEPAAGRTFQAGVNLTF